MTTTKPAPMEFDILDLLLILAARKRLIFLATMAGLVITAVLVFFVIRPTFTAQAVIMPPQQEQSSASALMGQLGGLASMSGVGSSLGLKNPNDLYIGILKSDTIADSIIRKFGLMRLYHEKLLSMARRDLANRSKFLSGKDSLIDISVEDHDPNRAAAMANAYVSELHNLNDHLAITQASQRRLFFEQQLAQEKDRLADAEVALRKTEEATGVIAPGGQTATIIRQIADLQAQITLREVELDALRKSSTEENPNVVQLNTELDSLRNQLQALESGQGKHARGDISIGTANVPGLGLEYIRKERDVKYHQLLFDLIARQYEAARMDEAKAAPVIQVVDPALPPDRKSGPHRLLWTLLAGFLCFFLSSAWAFAAHVYQRMQSDEMQRRRLELLREELRLRG
ncbi:MAG TPA: Wzz/FepE/Etk N-terminal domain-containing protein [Acidobacteriaceae bacterium]|nr:Wzz/FepE/Etk N-terminal domain-containing protein [Acidobacteriaceae bacterium]